MPIVNLPYVDAALGHMEGGGPSFFWSHLHWGLYDSPNEEDDSPERYHAAGKAMTEHIVAAGEVGDGARVLDVGCGFGGTLDYIRSRNQGCRLNGVNIDERQLHWARRLTVEGGEPITWIQADGCALPVADQSVDHVLAVECIFHFPSRKKFFREAARVLRPGGTLALSDFLLAPGSLPTFLETGTGAGLGESQWFGNGSRPPTANHYSRVGRGAGFEALVDDDVTERTMPTYDAIRRLYREAETEDGIPTVDGTEKLAAEGGWQYHVLSFRKSSERRRGGERERRPLAV